VLPCSARVFLSLFAIELFEVDWLAEGLTFTLDPLFLISEGVNPLGVSWFDANLPPLRSWRPL
jgi:hypothetical protein